MCTAIREMVQDGIEQGRSMGFKQGHSIGIGQGEEMLANLLKHLFADGRTDDVRAAVQDETTRKKLYQEYEKQFDS